VAAAALFWLSWLLMPGVGVTDSERILELVGSRRPAVLGSVVAQLISAVLYVPALCGVVADSTLGARTGVRWGAGLLLVGAMGSAADAVFHLLAYAMTAPDLDPATLVRVMDFMQGSGLFLIAPLIAAFFLGGAGLSVALGRAALVSRWNGWIHALALGVATLGGTFAAAGLVPSRLVGLATLGLVSVAQAWVGVALWKLGASEPR
jgi:hypothetical protein